MPMSNYITDAAINWTLEDINYESIDLRKKQEIVDRASADFEADMSQKFIVPLLSSDGSAFSNAPLFARNKVVNAMRSKIREIIGYDKNRNITGIIESTEKFINVHGLEYKEQLKSLLNPKISYGFKLQDQAVDSQSPVQHLGLARSDNSTDPNVPDGNGFW